MSPRLAPPPLRRLHGFRRRAPLIPLLPVAYRGSYVRRLLAPRRPVERALLSVIQQTYLAGASTRTVDALAETVGVPGTNPALVEAQASDWDRRVEAFRHRRLRDAYPYLLLFERTALIREAGEAQPASIVVAVAVTESGNREVVSLTIRSADTVTLFWETFLRDLKERGVDSLEVVTSDQLAGLLPALQTVYPGTRWQRCRESFITQTLATVPPEGRAAVEASLRGAFAEPDAQGAVAALAGVRARFEFAFPELVAALEAPAGSLLTYYRLPRRDRRLVGSLNALASLQRELRQSCQLVGIFPHQQALLRLAGTILQERSDEWVAYPQRLRRLPKAGAAVVWGGSASAAAWASRLAA
ncbi:MAG: putative transposase [Chloroflexota bacterium]|jgi:transposase-like protein|nr:putative transposase [Chloroflexota bacterium]